MKFDLIISDYDWTLGTSPAEISAKNLAAIKEFQNKGGKFAIVTGRSFSSILEICKIHNLQIVVGCFQGAHIVDLTTNKTLFSDGIDYHLAYTAITELLQKDMPVVAWVGDTLYYKEPSYYTEQYLGIEKISLVKTDNVAEAILQKRTPISKICFVCDAEETDKLVKEYAEKYAGKLVVNSGAKRLVEFIKPELNKGFAVRFIANYFNIPLNKVMTVGDSSNDFDLVSGEWHGVAVGNGDEKLKTIADEVTLPYTESAIAHLINKYCMK